MVDIFDALNRQMQGGANIISAEENLNAFLEKATFYGNDKRRMITSQPKTCLELETFLYLRSLSKQLPCT